MTRLASSAIAAAARFSLLRIRNGPNGARAFKSEMLLLSDVEVVNPTTFRIKLSKPSAGAYYPLLYGSETTIGYREGEDVAAALRWARARGLPGPYVLYGQSMGAAAVLRSVAACGAEPDGLIVESAFNRLLDTVSNRFEVMRVPAFPAARLLVFWGGMQTGFSGFEHNPEEYARACRMPALALHGEADAYAKPAEGRAVFQNLAGRKEWIAFPAAPHVALYGVDARRWRAAVAGFLDSVAK